MRRLGGPLLAFALVAGAPQSTLDDLEQRFLTWRPPVGPTWTVQIGSGSTAERLIICTLQGIVNRTSTSTTRAATLAAATPAFTR